jgi:hypothetical protein
MENFEETGQIFCSRLIPGSSNGQRDFTVQGLPVGNAGFESIDDSPRL